jgi:hypothetical protein
VNHLTRSVAIATLVTGALAIAFAIGTAIPVLKEPLYWAAMIPLWFLHVAGLKVFTSPEGFPGPNAFGYFVLALVVWAVSLGLALIIRRKR